ncbi:putative DNA-binding protein [Aureibacillus halotolerans]|uniref:UPF0122 protein EV213_102429 n=1 Tax=Aureibacillus halotolerans TaxID=1508390 RepID=A0A4R6UCB2_9BACI|nr:putative DNA-binding protein [Aureibacillus halotolerans]TDQ42395.1 hypothetical protein EV213_102429 [Aureibacillus halotolerans]
MIDKTDRMNGLFDFYSALLTDKQHSYMRLYYSEDWSLGEIAEHFAVSRQAVYDNIRRTENVLENYEEKLMLHEKFHQRSALLDELSTSLQHDKASEASLKVLAKIEAIE